MVNKCKGCTRREVGCHSKCEDYIEYRKKLNDIKYRKYVDLYKIIPKDLKGENENGKK